MTEQYARIFSLAPILAVSAALVLTPAPSAAQEWQEYRRDDFGFRIEMPGKPEIEVEESRDADGPVKTTTAEVSYGDIMFSVAHNEYSKGALASRPLDPWIDESRDLIQKTLGVKVTREARLTMNGFPAREIAFEVDGFHAIIRIVVMGDHMVQVGAISNDSLKGNAAVDRFLRSFTLLQGK